MRISKLIGNALLGTCLYGAVMNSFPTNEEKGKYDFVVSRAVMQTDELMRLVRKNIQKGGQNALPNGLICLKGGDLHAELLPFKKQAETWDLASVFEDPFFETKKVVYVCCP